MFYFLNSIPKSLWCFLVLFICVSLGAVEYDEEDDELIQQKDNEEKIIYVKMKEESQQKESRQEAVQPVSERPPTEILTEHPAHHEKLQKARQKAEQTTEGKIKERLETLRLRDEQERLNQLLPVQQDQGAVSTAGPSHSPEPSPSSAYSKEYIPANRYFARVGLGYLQYFRGKRPVVDVLSSQIWSVGLGVFEGKRIAFDVAAAFSTHRMTLEGDLTQNLFTHYNFTATLKYFLFPGRLKPFLGVLASYNNRHYTGDYVVQWGWNNRVSQTVNAGIVGGFELFIGSGLTAGVDVRTHLNIYSLHDPYNLHTSPYYVDYSYKIAPEDLTWATYNFFISWLF